ncbi:putative MFS family arabinose efflux permease [Streptomyces sp. TLI_235]|nr:MFS transporter [Streptomyces sp. TLI_235]PBC70916.1 putative MFS family arabinose efflux permease [Streptomyces sp. TLI_235]
MTGTADPAAPPQQDRWGLVAVAGLLSFTALSDMNAVNLALPSVADDLGVAQGTAQWAALGYQLPLVALLLPAGRWLDGVGLRAAVQLAAAGFALGGAAAAVAPGAAWLIAARAVQGVFGALLFVLMPVLAARAVRPALRARALSVPATLGPLGAVTGPALGGPLLDAAGWRAVLPATVPVCLVALWTVRRAAPPGEPWDGPLRVPDRASLADAALIGGAVAAVLLALTLTPGGWTLLPLAAASAVPAALWLRRPAGRATVALLTPVHGAVAALAAGVAAMQYLTALHLQRGASASATATGLAMLCFPLAMAVTGRVGGRLAERLGTRPTACAGAVLTAAGLLLLLGSAWTPQDTAWRLALAGCGMGLYGGPVQALALAGAPPGRLGAAGSAVQLARSLGFAVGPALATATATAGPGGLRTGLVAAASCVGSAAVLLAASGRHHRTA